jgi:hypothetical protein
MLSARVAHLAGGCCAGRFLIRLMTAVGRVSRGSPVQTAMRNCTRDEGRSFEAGSQVLASNRCKLLSSKAIVVSVAVSVGGDIPAGEVERGERKRTADELSKAD